MFDTETVIAIKDYMLAEEETVAVAESVTSGLIQASFSTAPDASKFFQGGLTAYNIGQKYRHLLVDPIHAQSCNCVSPRVAEEMAVNICKLFSANWGIAISGYATPEPQADNKLFAYYAISYKEKVVLNKRITTEKEEGLPAQLDYVQQVLRDFNDYLHTHH